MGTFKGMAQDIINSNSRIVIFGAGVVGSTITPQILREYNLENRLLCCIDNDKTRWNTTINICNKDIRILPPDILRKLKGNVTVLITISRYSGAYAQLDRMKGMEKFSCYIIPVLCVKNFHIERKKGVVKTSTMPLIPKRIHYMWLGGGEIPDQLKYCMESWKKYCPDYEIIRWDETNYDVHKNKFVAQAYDNGCYGFVPDYARIELLYEYGGIYLDTDVELQKNLDELLYQEAFCGVEKWQVLNFGGCSGAIKGHRALEPFLERWKQRSLIRDDGSVDNISSGLIDTTVALENGYKINGKNQNIMGMNIYTYDYFHPYDYMTGMLEKTWNTFSVHHFNGGWLNDKSRQDSEKALETYKDLLKTAINVDK